MYTLAFDIGGTFIKMGLVDEAFEISNKKSIKTPKEDVGREIIRLIRAEYLLLKDKHSISRIGISTAGKINRDLGLVVYASEHLKGYSGCNFKEELKDLDLEIYVENDVNSGALGEYMLLEEKPKSMIYLGIGTSIGGGILIDGQVYRGLGGAGELGHMIVESKGKSCNCGRRGCWESYASAKSLLDDYIDRSGEENIDGEIFFKKLDEKNEIALSVYKNYLEYFALGLSNIIHVFEPELIVISGGITNVGDRLIEDIKKYTSAQLMISYENTTIVRSKLGNDAALVGVSRGGNIVCGQ